MFKENEHLDTCFNKKLKKTFVLNTYNTKSLAIQYSRYVYIVNIKANIYNT